MTKPPPSRWVATTVGAACRVRNELRLPISRENRVRISGTYPYFGPTGELDRIAGFRLDGTYALIGEDGDHFLDVERKPQTLLVSGKFNVNNHAHVIESTEACSAEWFYNYFLHRSMRGYLTRQGAGRYKLTKAALERVPIVLPPLREQISINKALRTWDDAIKTTQRIAALTLRNYAYELQRLITRSRHPMGQIRAFAAEVSERNPDGENARVLTVTNSRGFVRPEDHFARRVASANLTNYKVVRRGQYAYNPSRLNVGSIARLDEWNQGVLSPMYVVFCLDESCVNSDYFQHWLKSHYARQHIKRSAQGSVRETVPFGDFAAMAMQMPSLDRQVFIARYLNALRYEIDALSRYAAALQKQKRGLMQKLLTGEWRLPATENTETADA